MFRRQIVYLRDCILDFPLFRKALENECLTFASESTRHPATESLGIVSIIMAVKDCEKTIAASIQSLLSQTYQNIEIIVINDGSKDRTQTIVASLLKKDARIKLVTLDSSYGTSTARNLALSICKGDYITFQDGDDYSHPSRIIKQLKKLTRNRKLNAVLCDYVRVSDKGEMLSINSKRARKCIISMMFTRKTFRTIGYFADLSISEDSDYYQRIKAVFGQHNITYISRILYRASFSPNSRMFGNGTTEIHGARISHHKSKIETEVDRRLREKHASIVTGKIKAYIGKQKALSKIRRGNYWAPKQDLVTVFIQLDSEKKSLFDRLESLTKQTYGRNNIEIFVLSTESSSEISPVLEQYQFLPFVNLIFLVESDAHALMKTALAHASGKYVIELDDQQSLKNTSIKHIMAQTHEGAEIQYAKSVGISKLTEII